ncbi:hypothetical protein ACFWPY_07890 [Streptomyces sp. NPDC058527]|uniref:hypothetical protein n=1 Tax=unclassified Streptomyces TaxID=2593676 RepID=UPI0036596A1B
MSQVPRWLLRHRISIEPYIGDSAYGPRYGPPVTGVRALVAEQVRTVRDREGRETVSTAQVITAPGTVCPAESRITLPTGRITRVLSAAPHTAPGLPVPESLEVMCE